MSINEHAVDLAVYLLNECVSYFKKHNGMKGFQFCNDTLQGLRHVFNASGLEEDDSFDDFIQFVYLSIRRVEDDRFLRIASIALFFTRCMEIGFTRTRDQLPEGNEEYINMNLLKLELDI